MWKPNYTLSLWDYSKRPAEVIVPQQKVTLYGTECHFLGIAPNEWAYFWLNPEDTRSLDNNELMAFKLAVISHMEIKRALDYLQGRKS